MAEVKDIREVARETGKKVTVNSFTGLMKTVVLIITHFSVQCFRLLSEARASQMETSFSGIFSLQYLYSLVWT
jgi:hypothetical protein